ncbi:MAG TPA: hypothetical protein VGC66_07275 [Pyrinomonadaceae bacterium]|jgi:hypothetical protein
MKKLIQETFRNNVHYVWCSESFDSQALSKHTAGYLIAPSSNPADIYKELKGAVTRNDRHCSKISEQILTLTNLAIIWEQASEITSQHKEDIVWMLNNLDISYWRPLLYVVPRVAVESRMRTVPMAQRASFGIEYIIEDLHQHEFDMIEV